MTLSPRTLTIAGLVLVAFVLLADPIRFLGAHRVVYGYDWGFLSTDPVMIWAGPFTKATMGTSDYQQIGRPVADIYMHVPQAPPIRIRTYTQQAFVATYEEAYQVRHGGHVIGPLGDANLLFLNGKLAGLEIWWHENSPSIKGKKTVGWPCWSKTANSEKHCFPLSGSAAEDLFGDPNSRRSYGLPWI